MKRLSVVLLVALLLATVTQMASARKITPTGMSQGDLVAYITLLQTRINGDKDHTLTYSNVHKHAAGSATLDIGTTFGYSIDGYTYSKAASDTIADVTATAQSTGTSNIYLLSVDSSGDVTTTAGTAVAEGSTPAFPALPASTAPFAAIAVDIASTAAAGFTLGTTAFDYDTVATITVYSLSNVPEDDIDLTDF